MHFEMEPMIINFGDSQFTWQRVDLLKTLLLDNVAISHLRVWTSFVRELRRDTRLATQKFGELMGCIFDSERRPLELAYTWHHSETATIKRPSHSETPPLQIDAIDLLCDSYDDRSGEFAAMRSALATNQTTEKLSMWMCLQEDIPQHVDGAYVWKWLAYALFSKRARGSSALKTLALTSIDNFSVGNVQSFASIVTSNHPEEDVCGCPRGQVPDRDAILKKRSPIHWRLTPTGRPREGFDPLVMNSPTRSVRTFSDDGKSDLVNALISSFGRCLAKRSDLVFSEDNTISQGGISSLFLGFSDEGGVNLDGLPRFLSVVGTSLKFLTLNSRRLEIDTSVVLRSCPNLEELALSKSEVEVRLNFGSYHASKQPLPALDCNWYDVCDLVERLSGVNSVLAKCVRRLRLRLHHRGHAETDVVIDALTRKMKANRILEYLEVILPLYYGSTDIDILLQCHRTPACRGLGLSTAVKIAILSVLSQPTTSHRESSKRGRVVAASYRLDEHVLSSVFAFAATLVVRQVYVRRQWGHSTRAPI